MYKKFHKNDELFTGISFSFSLLLLTLFLIYKKVIEDQMSDMDFYFYIVVSVLIFAIFVYSVVFFFLNYNFRKLDVAIDLSNNLINISNKRNYTLNQAIMFGYHESKKLFRMYINGRLYGFHFHDFTNEFGEKLSRHEMEQIAEKTTIIKHQHLYNYDLMIGVLVITFLYFYAYLDSEFIVFNISLTTVFMFMIGFILMTIFYISNRYRMNRVMNKVNKNTL